MDSMRRRATSQPGQRRISARDHDTLVGNVQRWLVCSLALRAVLPLLYVMSSHKSGPWLASEDEGAWQEHDDGKALLWQLIQLGRERPQLLQTNLVSSIDTYDVMRLPRGVGLPVRCLL